jgi:hypothetical protein
LHRAGEVGGFFGLLEKKNNQYRLVQLRVEFVQNVWRRMRIILDLCAGG